jgi:TRAP transporter 4TM/12TM fusion protein
MRAPAGLAGRAASLLAAGLAAYAIYWVLFIVQPQVYRVSFLLIALVLTLLLYPATAALRRSDRVPLYDWILIALAVVAFSWPLIDFRQFVYRAAEPATIDLILGTIAIALVLEATRRAVGWVLPATAIAFLLYAWAGPLLDRIGLDLIAHRGYGPARLVGTLYMTLEGIFGVPLDVTATYIVLFTIYGALLDASGAGRFFIDWALKASGRSVAAPGRSVTIAGFLLGTVSGSGVATTVMLGSVAWPLLRRARYSAETAGAMLSAAGIGALLSPPTLGAAAFLIAEFLQISYLQILVMATIPTLLYYFSILLMIEADARRMAAGLPPAGGSHPSGVGVASVGVASGFSRKAAGGAAIIIRSCPTTSPRRSRRNGRSAGTPRAPSRCPRIRKSRNTTAWRCLPTPRGMRMSATSATT